MAENVAMAGDEGNQFLARYLMIGWITAWTMLGMLIGAGSLMIYLGHARWTVWYVTAAALFAYWRASTSKIQGTAEMKPTESILSGLLAVFSFAVLALFSFIFHKIAYWAIYLLGLLFAGGPARASAVALKLAFWVPMALSIVLGFAFVMSTCNSMARELIDEDGKRLFRSAIQRQKAKALLLSGGMIVCMIAFGYFALFLPDRKLLLLSMIGIFFIGAYLSNIREDAVPKTKPLTQDLAMDVAKKLLESIKYEVHILSKSMDPYSAGIDLLALGHKLAVAGAVLGPWTSHEDAAANQFKSAATLREAGWVYVRRYYPTKASGLCPVVFLAGVEPANGLLEYGRENDIEIVSIDEATIHRLVDADAVAIEQAAMELLPVLLNVARNQFLAGEGKVS